MSKNVRDVAVELVFDIRYNQGYINKALQSVTLDKKDDMPLLTHIVYGSIKNYEYLEALLAEKIELNKSKRIVRTTLVVAMYQLLYLDNSPAYAIINQTVSFVKRKTNQFTANFVNNILRGFSKETEMTFTLDPFDPYTEVAITESIPLWMVKLVASQYSLEAATVFFKEMKKPPEQFARVNCLQATKEEVLQEPGFSEIKEVSETINYDMALRYTLGNIATTAAFQKGKVSIQNISSQQVAIKLNPQVGERIWDICAAPGGKTTHIAELMGDSGEIVATDLYEARVEQIKQNADRLGIKSIQTKVIDALEYSDSCLFDRILLDAPCSGFGVMSQKPEIKYQIKPEDLDILERLQSNLLEVAEKNLKPGGTLLYSTCTINKKENEKQIVKFLQKNPQMKLIEEKTYLSEVVNGNSGFFYAILLKEQLQ